ncbi:serine hydrolase [Natronoglomus mannanivorans]|uniref:Serine hydrolase n=1 Tax=Natronoglomus mannanivorans TaxID=2979990 RepID=A0AAP2YUU2_9EURY|nr:serine hydrolase [Halobacteria archaeon AArc-xg1-1]
MAHRFEEEYPWATVERRIETWIDESGCPGASVAVVDGTKPVSAYEAGFGVRRLEPDAPATPETLYGVGSVTKPITATAVLTLVDAGEISLDDPVVGYVPYFEDVPGEAITVHELLSHTSGMPDDDMASVLLGEGSDAGASIDGWDDFRSYVDGASTQRRLDRERCLYYNSGYAILARLVETVSGRSFAEFVDRAVFEPLEMDDATFDVGVLDDRSRDVMTPYHRDDEADDGFRSGTLPNGPVFEGPGGLLAPVTDLSAFLAAQIGGGPHLADRLRERAYDPVGTHRRLVGDTTYGYGYGWESRPFGSDTLIGHGGGTGVSGGYIGFLRERGLGIAIGCNTHPSVSPATLAMEVLAILTDRDPASVVPERAIERSATELAGRYESYGGVHTATVEWTGARLEVEFGASMGGGTLEFAPTSLDPDEYEFATVEGDGTRLSATFFVGDERVELLFDQLLLERVDGRYGEGDGSGGDET